MIGVGLSDQGVARELLLAWGGPLLVSSANPTGEPSPLSYEQVRSYGFDVPLFGDTQEAQQTQEEPPRVTVVGLSHYEPKALSEGCVTQAQLSAEWARLKANEVI
jgi:tRNA A37 threonylcarbamoyladenosine synthetase subunit TsaC/SUA5/YrdC